ncbi:unnamed protein product, partial [Owenia fusiformis]
MALKKVKGTLERVLDKNLQDLVRGIRNHRESEAKYIAECIDEIKEELRQDNVAVKANAVQKLTYIQMLGYDISWAAFNMIEVMSSTKFTHKRIGYLAASQCFHDDTDVIMLTTNMIRKDLNSQNLYDAGVALNGLSNFITPDLARDLANDIMTLMTSTKPYLRKKAVLIMYKVFLAFPEALRPAFPRLKEKLEDGDPGVQSAVVNVICELARKNPKNYLSLAPLFFKLMTTSSNNWVLIKIIKLFGALTPLEPRLGKKLIEPLTNLIHSTSAMSLLYECINTVIAGVPSHSASIQLCVQKLRILIEDSDQNLKYLGLLAMSRILKTHPKSVQAHKDLVLQCLDDKDESIRLRALDLLYGMVSKKNLMEIVKKLMVHMDKAEGSNYRDELLAKIIEICSQSNYQFITNFEWYVSVLVELTRLEGTRHGKIIASQMLDVAIRVQAIRPFAVAQMATLLDNAHLLTNNSQRNGICEVLYAAAWICGEFSEHLPNSKQTLESMLRPKVTQLPGHIQSIYVQNLIKLYSSILVKGEADENLDDSKEAAQLIIEKLPLFVQSADLEVQERACCILQLMKYVVKLQDKGVAVGEEVSALFAGELNPVAAKAQKKVPVPEGLNLDKWINDPPSESSEDEGPTPNIFMPSDEHRSNFQSEEKKSYQPTAEELSKQREARKMEQENNPNYLKGPSRPKTLVNSRGAYEDVPEVAELALEVPLHIPGLPSSDKYIKMQREQMNAASRKKKDKKKKKKRSKKGHVVESEEEDDIPVVHHVSAVLDEPEGGDSDKEDKTDRGNDQYAMLDMNLDEPLRDDERLPVRQHRVVGLEPREDEATLEDKPKKKHKKEKKKKEKKEKSKEKKKKRIDSEEPEESPSLLVSAVEETPGEPHIETNGITPEVPQVNGDINGSKKEDDLDFWLSGKDAESPVKDIPIIKEPVNNTHGSDADTEQPEEKSKKKKEKKHKKEKKRKKNRSDYEIAEGITTPSKEHANAASPQPEQALPPMTNYKLLSKNDAVQLTYETRVSQAQSNQVVVSVILSNLSCNHIKELEFNVLDSMNTKLVRGVGASSHDPVKVPFILLPSSQNEGQFAFTVQSITMPQRLKGTLTYMVKTEEGSTHEKLDFKLPLPCSSYLLATP